MNRRGMQTDVNLRVFLNQSVFICVICVICVYLRFECHVYF